MIPTTDTGQERRILNEAIEHSYIECAGLSASIKTHFQTGSGIIRDLYELFYFNVAVLYDLTADLSEMSSSIDEVTSMGAWLNLPPLKNTGKDIETRCKDGLALFRKYKIALSKNGVLALPS